MLLLSCYHVIYVAICLFTYYVLFCVVLLLILAKYGKTTGKETLYKPRPQNTKKKKKNLTKVNKNYINV